MACDKQLSTSVSYSKILMRATYMEMCQQMCCDAYTELTLIFFKEHTYKWSEASITFQL